MFSKKLTRLLAVGVTALFLGATSLHAQTPPPPPDADGDGVADDGTDQCLDTDLTATTVVIDGVDTGIPNSFFASTGCTLDQVVNEMVDECALNAKNHGKFVSCVSHQTNALKRAKMITGKQKGKIQSIVAHMSSSSTVAPPQ